jgi:hypothetical protein
MFQDRFRVGFRGSISFMRLLIHPPSEPFDRQQDAAVHAKDHAIEIGQDTTKSGHRDPEGSRSLGQLKGETGSEVNQSGRFMRYCALDLST